MFNFLRYGDKNNSIVFDLTAQEKESIINGSTTMDAIYDKVMENPVDHIRTTKKRGIQRMMGISGIINGDVDSSNGAGKSTIMEAICYAHYEKIVRKTANASSADKVGKAGLSVVTKIDGKYPVGMQESYVEELFEDNGRIYRLKRGRLFKKNQKDSEPLCEFECINRNEIDSQSGHRSKDTKDAISDVITMDYDVFVNSVMFGQNDAGKYLMGTDKVRKEMLISLLKLENVVSGCLDLIRKKKNAQDKKVQSIQSNIELLESVFCEAYAKFNQKQIDSFESSFIDAIFTAIDQKKQEAKDEILVFDKELSEIELNMSELVKSDKIANIETVKEEGKKIVKEKKDKEQVMSDQIAEWQRLKNETGESQTAKERQLLLTKQKNQKINSQIDKTKNSVASYSIDEHNNNIMRVKKAKELDPINKSKLELLEKERDGFIRDIATISGQIQINSREISRSETQLKNVGGSGKFLCEECKSVVPKEHILEKYKSNIEQKKEKEKEKENIEKKSSEKDSEISKVKETLRKINDYILLESKFNLNLKEYEDAKTRLVELNASLAELNEEEKSIAKEIESLQQKEKTYSDKCDSIRAIHAKDILELDQKIIELKQRYKKVEEDAKEVNTQIEKLNGRKKEVSEQKTKKIQALGSLSQERDNFEKQKDTLDEKHSLLNAESKTFNRLVFLEEVFGLEGIQTRIVKKYLPLLNVYIKEFLDILSGGEMSVKMFINDRLKVDLKITGGTADTFEMLSGGEKMVVRLATDIGLALLAFSRTAQKPEIICLDEIFASLDENKTVQVFVMLERLVEKFNRVIVISHRQNINDLIKNQIIVEKQSGQYGLSRISRIT